MSPDELIPYKSYWSVRFGMIVQFIRIAKNGDAIAADADGYFLYTTADDLEELEI